MSLVVDELESSIVSALPGETDAENAYYLRDLIQRLEIHADNLSGGKP
ncbi:hypothetical protein [Mycolicibacterium sp.]